MPLILDVLLAVGLSAAFAGAVRLWRRAVETGRREDLQALAARRGWSLTVTGERLGRGGSLRIASRGGHAWEAEVRADVTAGGVVTEYEADSPRWAEGTLIAYREAADAPGVEPTIGPDLATRAAGLPRRTEIDSVILLSDADPGLRLIPDDLARAFAGWTAPGTPVLLLGPEGLRLRLRTAIDRADRMERFVDLAFDLSRVIGP